MAIPSHLYAKAEARLHALGVRTAGDLASLLRPRLVAAVGAATAARLAAAATAGVDPEPVTPSGPPQSLCVEDSFKGCDSLQQLQMVLRVLGPDLQRRLQQDRTRHRRTPRALLVRWRFAGARTMHVPDGAAAGRTVSRSVPMPGGAARGAGGVAALEAAAAAVRSGPVPSRLQPCVIQAATLCDPGCNPV